MRKRTDHGNPYGAARAGLDEPLFLQAHKDKLRLTLADLDPWFELYGNCLKCPHVGPVSREHLSRRFGAKASLKLLELRLRCTRCGNCQGNAWLVGKMPR